MWEVEVHKIEPGLAGLGLSPWKSLIRFTTSHLITFLPNFPHLHWALANIPGGESGTLKAPQDREVSGLVLVLLRALHCLDLL